jgi:uncharacterized protein (UPF0335 family)
MSNQLEAEAVHDTLRNHVRPSGSDGIAKDRLRSIVDRIERLEEEKRALISDIKDIYTEAKSAGFDGKVIRRLIADRRCNQEEVEEQYTLLDIYRRQIGM